MSTAEHYSGKKFPAFGATFTKTEVGTKYDYSLCGDPVLNDLLEASKVLAEKVKARMERLKAQKEPENILDEVSGEVYLITPPIKRSKSGLNVSIK
jgi:hypothetical protein